MKTVTERKYINQMLPHLLPLRAKKIGITQKNREEWKSLAKKIKKELVKRYAVATDGELLHDLSYKRSKTIKKESRLNNDGQTKQFDDLTNKIVDNIPDISYLKRQWIKKTRTELSSKLTTEEIQILRELVLQKINVIHKMPFIVSGNIYFADVYLPNHKMIIEIVNEKKLQSIDKRKIEKRLLDLNKTGNKLITVNREKAKNKIFIHTLVHLILKQSDI